MGAVASLKSLVLPDDVATLEARSASCAAELASLGESQIVLERALLDAEKHGDIKAGDAAVAKLESAAKQIDRLRIRRSAIAEALTTAKASKSAAEKAARVEAYRAAAGKAKSACDVAEKTSVALCVKLSEVLAVYATEGARERDAVAAIAREGGGIVGCARRSFGLIEAAAMREAQVLTSLEFCLPALK